MKLRMLAPAILLTISVAFAQMPEKPDTVILPIPVTPAQLLVKEYYAYEKWCMMDQEQYLGKVMRWNDINKYDSIGVILLYIEQWEEEYSLYGRSIGYAGPASLRIVPLRREVPNMRGFIRWLKKKGAAN